MTKRLLNGFYSSAQQMLRDFLRASKSSSLSANQVVKGSDRAVVVLGNESCDLDSAVCALTLAYFHKELTGKKFVWPVLNICQKDFRIRTEVRYLLNKHLSDSDYSDSKINVEDVLIFQDHLDLGRLVSSQKLDLCLVDHNALCPSMKHLEPSVVKIVDHHKLTESSVDIKRVPEVKIEKVGSCSTLVAELILQHRRNLMTSAVADLLYSTILVDTVCLSTDVGKTTPKDVEILETLETHYLSQKVEDVDGFRRTLFDEIQREKSSVEDLSVREILRKDAKFLRTKLAPLGICSVPVSLQELFCKSDGIESVFAEFCHQEKIGLLMILAIKVDAERAFRQLAIFSQEDPLRRQAVLALHPEDGSLTLGLSEFDHEIRLKMQYTELFNQENLKMGRKQILPALETAFSF